MKFSEKLMELRKSKGMSQEDLAEKLNVTRQTVSKWELDQTTPDMNKLIEISKLFEVSLDELANNVDTTNSENTYKESSTEKNNTKLSIKIFIAGIIIALVLCGMGFYKQNDAKRIEEERKSQAYEQSQKAIDQANSRLEEIKKEMETLETQINNFDTEIKSMQNESQTIFMQDSGFSERYNAKKLEIDSKEKEQSQLETQYYNLEQEKFQIENGDYTVYYDLVKPITYNIYYYIAAGVFALMSLIALIYFLATRKK